MQKLDTKLFASSLYWSDHHWSFVMVPDAERGFEFITDNAVEIDRRAAAWFFFTFYPKVLSEHAGPCISRRLRTAAGSHCRLAGHTSSIERNGYLVVLKDNPANCRRPVLLSLLVGKYP
jgi:hypothetical protein